MEKVCNTCKRVYSGEADFLAGTTRWRICSLGNLWFECRCKSTLMLPKGKFSWYDPTHFLKPAAKSIFNRLGGMKDLPYIPNTIMRLLTLMESGNIDVQLLAEEVKKEPFIATEVFRIATNLRDSRNPGQTPMDCLEHAILYVGVTILKDLVITASLKKFKFKVKTFNPDTFWKEAHLCGFIAERFARRLSLRVNADEVYLAGVLVNIGKLVGAICLPEEADQAYVMCSDPKTAAPWNTIEQNLGLTSHITLGEIGCSIWGLPAYISEAITAHHDAEAVRMHVLKSRLPEFYWVVAFANQMTHKVLLQPERLDMPLFNDVACKLGLNPDDIDLWEDELVPLRDWTAA